MRGSVSLPRSIGESKPLLMFHSSVSHFHVFTFLFLYQVFLHLMLPESQKCWQTVVWVLPASLFALDPRRRKRGRWRRKKKQPPAALHPLLNTLSLPHSCKAALHRWAKLKCLCPRAEEHPGPKPLCNQFSYFATVSSSNFLFLQLAFALSTHTASLLHWSVFAAVMLP